MRYRNFRLQAPDVNAHYVKQHINIPVINTYKYFAFQGQPSLKKQEHVNLIQNKSYIQFIEQTCTVERYRQYYKDATNMCKKIFFYKWILEVGRSQIKLVFSCHIKENIQHADSLPHGSPRAAGNFYMIASIQQFSVLLSFHCYFDILLYNLRCNDFPQGSCTRAQRAVHCHMYHCTHSSPYT